MSRSFTLHISGIPPGINELRRRHYYAWHEEKKAWSTACYGAAVQEIGRLSQTWAKKVRITVRFHFPDYRRRDPDNYSSAAKFLIDGLKSANVMPDDDFNHVELVICRGRVDRRHPHVEVVVEDIGESDSVDGGAEDGGTGEDDD